MRSYLSAHNYGFVTVKRIRVRRLKICFIVTAVAAGLMSTVAAGGSAAATTYPNAHVSQRTPDGWLVGAALTHYAIDRVPDLNQSPLTREAFLDLSASAAIAGAGGSAVQAGTLTLGVQLSCQADLSGGANVGVAVSPTVGVTISYPPALTAGVGVTPSVSVAVKPGVITDTPIATKKLQGAGGGIQMSGIHIHEDGCWGGIAVRPFAAVAISTAGNDTTVTAYGQPNTL